MSRNSLSEGAKGGSAAWFQRTVLGFDFSLCGVVCSLMSLSASSVAPPMFAFCFCQKYAKSSSLPKLPQLLR